MRGSWLLLIAVAIVFYIVGAKYPTALNRVIGSAGG